MKRIYLPSNGSLQYFPNNGPSSFSNKCPTGFLDPGKKWQCALSEIQFPKCYFNVTEGNNTFEISFDNKVHKIQNVLAGEMTGLTMHSGPTYECELKPGYYASTHDLISEMSSEIRKCEVAFKKEYGSTVSLIQNRNTKKMNIKLGKGISLKLYGNLAVVLGYPANSEIFGERTRETLHESEFTANVHRGHDNIYVYTNIIVNQQIEEQQRQLLRVVDWPHLETTQVNMDTVVRQFVRPFYCDLKTTSFDTIDILLTDDMGKPIQFLGGFKVLCILDFIDGGGE